MVTGTPSSAPSARPLRQRAVLCSAACVAPSLSSVMSAFSRGLTSALRCRQACSASVGVNAASRKPAASSVAVSCQSDGIPGYLRPTTGPTTCFQVAEHLS
ncbi:hypothetical protein D3C85_380380 [compost metagenome]